MAERRWSETFLRYSLAWPIRFDRLAFCLETIGVWCRRAFGVRLEAHGLLAISPFHSFFFFLTALHTAVSSKLLLSRDASLWCVPIFANT